MPEDHAVSLDILNGLDSERIRVFGNYSDRDGLLDEIAGQDLFVGVKLHTVIAACCVYTPAIMLGYQPKCLDFMRTMDMEAYHIRTDRLDLDHLIEMIRFMSGDLESIQKRQFESVQLFRGRLLEYRDRVLESIGMRPTSGEMRRGEPAPSKRD
jgi:polysaccharide pyruvyl transferase WcaK-like protein